MYLLMNILLAKEREHAAYGFKEILLSLKMFCILFSLVIYQAACLVSVVARAI